MFLKEVWSLAISKKLPATRRKRTKKRTAYNLRKNLQKERLKNSKVGKKTI